jgi:multiple antibiotic resistance protein
MWYTLAKSVAETFLALLPIVNPVGGAPIFFGLTSGDQAGFRLQQARLVALYVGLILGVFLVAGEPLLTFFGIKLAELEVAGGLLVAYAGWQLLNTSSEEEARKGQDARGNKDIAFTPMALPLMAGPGAIGVVIGISVQDVRLVEYAGSLIGIAAIALVSYVSLALSGHIMARLGHRGVDAINRVLGFFILAIAIHFIAGGIFGLLPGSPSGPPR